MINSLNAEQQRAAEVDGGPVMVVAGPGTGKTKTLTARIEYLIGSGKAKPSEILALTFTKKAAEEMRNRAKTASEQKPQITTFHALCHELLGDSQTPFITDTQRLQIIKSLPRMQEFVSLSAREIGLIISRAKNLPNIEDKTSELVRAYNNALTDQGLRDFDDLLLEAYKQLRSNEGAHKNVQDRYKYILVDEFQDTNRLQYEILKLLLGHNNIFVIGDPNQSIYGFRGASGTIFAEFEQDFPGAQKITLHINYRSVPEVVKLSNAIFKTSEPLEANAKTQGRVQAVQVLNEYSEANWVLGQIQNAIGGGDLMRAVSDDERTDHKRLSDFAILYRSRSCAITLQKAIDESGLPYQIVGDGSPYEKPEVQTAISLLKSLATGETHDIKGLSKNQIHSLLTGIDKTLPPSDIISTIAVKFDVSQTQQLTQLANTLVRFDSLPSAVKYLDSIAEQQFYDSQADVITLLTTHAAKGLEFPHVFLIGAEQDILPHRRSDIAEERRLFFVAITRARENLDILHAKTRSGKPATPSRFITEVPDTVLPKITDDNLATDQRRAHKRKLKRSQQALF